MSFAEKQLSLDVTRSKCMSSPLWHTHQSSARLRGDRAGSSPLPPLGDGPTPSQYSW